MSGPRDDAIDTGYSTHIGRRKANEDALRIIPRNKREYLFAVADGMGGHHGGDLASRMACDGLDGYFNRLQQVDAFMDVQEYRRHLEEIVMRISRQIHLRGLRDPELEDMGTTLSCLVITGRHSIIAHVGDSRIYRYRNGHLSCLTVDHTFVQDMILEGEVDPDQADSHPLRHVLTRAVGTAEPLERVDTRIDLSKPQDRFLLCTDGLHNQFAMEQIQSFLSKPWRAQKIAATLVNEAYMAGSKDNITAVVVIHGRPDRPGNEKND